MTLFRSMKIEILETLTNTGGDYQMQITWTNCAEKMPPDDANYLIIFREVASGLFDKNNGAHMNLARMKYLYDWTPYTPEKWKELNK